MGVFAGLWRRILHFDWAASCWGSRTFGCLVPRETRQLKKVPTWMWKLLNYFVFVLLDKKKISNFPQDIVEDADLNLSATEGEDSTPAKEQKAAGGLKNWGMCSIPCDVTIKLLRDEKHSICGKNGCPARCESRQRRLFRMLSVYIRSSVAAISAVVRAQHPQTHPGCDGGAAASAGHPQRSSEVGLFTPKTCLQSCPQCVDAGFPLSGGRVDEQSADTELGGAEEPLGVALWQSATIPRWLWRTQLSHSSNIYECSCHVYVLLWSCGAFWQYKPHDVIRLSPDWSLFGPQKFTRKACVCRVLKLWGCQCVC